MVMTAAASHSLAMLQAVAMVIATELGDKTFFIAAVLAMRKNPMHVFIGCWGALATMTVLSAFMGYLMPTLLSPRISHWAAIALFTWFGGKAVFDAFHFYREGKGIGASEELAETEKEISEDNAILKESNTFSLLVSIFVTIFLAEWGDKSQIATIAMGASGDTIGVVGGAILGHAFCTGVAILGGRMLSARISERQVVLSSGVLFLGFALYGIVTGPEA